MIVAPGSQKPTASDVPVDRRVGRSIFGQDAAGYDRARSAYPEELYELLAQLTVPEPRIAEIGAGTGLATTGLLNLRPRRLTLIEPDAGMAAFLADRFAQEGTEVVCAPFPDNAVKGPFDLVGCAAAFHWLNELPALARIRALLVPEGVWAVWWNCYFGHGQPDPFGDRVNDILREARVALPPSYVGRRHYAFDVAHHVAVLQSAGFENIDHRVFVTPRSLTPGEARALFATFSFIQLLEATSREALLDRIGTLINDEFAGMAPSVCATALYTSRTALPV